MGIFARISGLNRLVEQYPVKMYPEGKELNGQTVQIGLVRYRDCTTVIISSTGLYLNIKPPLGSSSKMLIPWDEIKGISQTRLYGNKAIRLLPGSSGKNSLIVSYGLFNSMRAYLKSNLIP